MISDQDIAAIKEGIFYAVLIVTHLLFFWIGKMYGEKKGYTIAGEWFRIASEYKQKYDQLLQLRQQPRSSSIVKVPAPVRSRAVVDMHEDDEEEADE